MRVPSLAPGVCSALALETCLVRRPLALPGARGRLAAAIEFALILCVCVCVCLLPLYRQQPSLSSPKMRYVVLGFSWF